MRKRVAIIGGGIFGVSAACVLAEFCDVVLLERRGDLLAEATWTNQYRHHYGYHYPRSPETIAQCREARADFESLWGRAIFQGWPAYYAIARRGSHVTPAEFIAVCDRFSLPYRVVATPEAYIDPATVVCTVLTPEPVYDHALLRRIAQQELAERKVQVQLGTEVTAGRLAASEQKLLQLRTGHEQRTEAFDVAINATYANFNVFCQWFGIAGRDIEFRLKEVLVVRIPGLTACAATIMDGPFATLVPAGHTGLFTLGDVPLSIHEIRVSSGGVPWSQKELREVTLRSRAREIMERDADFIPAVRAAELVQSLWAILPIMPESKATDERRTEVVDHGAGCWSVFEGKIITAVTAARKIAAALRTA